MTTSLDSLETVSAFSTLLRSLLGDYVGKFSDGKDAFWVEPPYIPAKRTFTGLAVVANRNTKPLQPQQPCVGVPQALQRMYRTVTLINNDFSPEGLLKWDNAIDRIRTGFPFVRERSTETTEDKFPQVTFLLDFSKIVNLTT